MPFLAVAKMKILGITLIVVGLALLCGGLIFYRSSEGSGDRGEDSGEASRKKPDEPAEGGPPVC